MQILLRETGQGQAAFKAASRIEVHALLAGMDGRAALTLSRHIDSRRKHHAALCTTRYFVDRSHLDGSRSVGHITVLGRSLPVHGTVILITVLIAMLAVFSV
jgi:hypothetical protein